MAEYKDYYDERRDIGWEKFDADLSGLAVQLIGSEFDSIDTIPQGVRFNQAYTLKIVDEDWEYLNTEEEDALVLEYDRNSEAYDEDFVERFTDVFSGDGEIKEKIEENFDVLFR